MPPTDLASTIDKCMLVPVKKKVYIQTKKMVISTVIHVGYQCSNTKKDVNKTKRKSTRIDTKRH